MAAKTKQPPLHIVLGYSDLSDSRRRAKHWPSPGQVPAYCGLRIQSLATRYACRLRSLNIPIRHACA